jgi:hypothetical protein
MYVDFRVTLVNNKDRLLTHRSAATKLRFGGSLHAHGVLARQQRHHPKIVPYVIVISGTEISCILSVIFF